MSAAVEVTIVANERDVLLAVIEQLLMVIEHQQREIERLESSESGRADETVSVVDVDAIKARLAPVDEFAPAAVEDFS